MCDRRSGPLYPGLIRSGFVTNNWGTELSPNSIFISDAAKYHDGIISSPIDYIGRLMRAKGLKCVRIFDGICANEARLRPRRKRSTTFFGRRIRGVSFYVPSVCAEQQMIMRTQVTSWEPPHVSEFNIGVNWLTSRGLGKIAAFNGQNWPFFGYGVIKNVFGGLRVSRSHSQLALSENDRLLVLAKRSLHQLALLPVNVRLNNANNENAQSYKDGEFLRDVSLWMATDPQPYPTPPHGMPEAHDDWWFYGIVVALSLIAVGFAIHIVRSGVI